MYLTTLVTFVLGTTLVSAHPGHSAKEVAERQNFLLNSRSDLSHCADEMLRDGLYDRNAQRRAELAQGLMKKRGLEVRQLSSLNKTHESHAGYTPSTGSSVVFAGNRSCALVPEQIDGPYYVAGEKIRHDVTEGQEGVPLTLDIQIVDMDTCQPIPGAHIEIWHANSTGVYSGVAMNGNGGGSADRANLNATWLRGAQATDAAGAAQFATVFPGFYEGRAVHVHVAVHLGVTPLANDTLVSTRAAHVGQMYFDQALIDDVVALPPYSRNTKAFVPNARDFVLTGAAATSDPIMEFARLGGGVGDGLLAWLSLGINTTFVHDIVPAATHYESGGQPNPNAMAGPPPGGFPGGGPPGFPPGFPPPPGKTTAR